jgi:hypothetical protein
VDERRDDLDAWLSARVQPLLPPPGTFDRIHSQARRRRVRRAALSAAGALALTAVAAVVIPQVVISTLQAGRAPAAPGALRAQRTSPQHHTPAAHSPTPSPAPSTGPGPAVSPVPPPLSVTFVGAATGWVMGQTSPAAQCDLAAAPNCLVLERTDSAGAAWRQVHPPPAHGPDGATGVSQIRFLNRSNGWAFGPGLLATHDAGRTWARVSTGGLRVTALEARGKRVFAVWAHCTGPGPGFAAHCTSFRVYSSPGYSDRWAPVAGPVSGSGVAGTASAASLVMTSVTEYLLTPGGTVFSGPVTGGAWHPVTASGSQVPLPCSPGAAQPDGQPGGALLAADASSDLVLLCTGPAPGGGQRKALYISHDGGQTWHFAGNAPRQGTATALSGSPSGTLVLATSRGIEVSAGAGATWTAATVAAPPGGFAYVGMTTDLQGIAVPADPGQHAIWFTYNGARTWHRSPVGA